jgi:hypothetical protein
MHIRESQRRIFVHRVVYNLRRFSVHIGTICIPYASHIFFGTVRKLHDTAQPLSDSNTASWTLEHKKSLLLFFLRKTLYSYVHTIAPSGRACHEIQSYLICIMICTCSSAGTSRPNRYSTTPRLRDPPPLHRAVGSQRNTRLVWRRDVEAQVYPGPSLFTNHWESSWRTAVQKRRTSIASQ